MKEYAETLDYLYGLQRFGIKMGLETVRDLCALLGDPQERYPSVHIGGTNGKGSTAAVLESILREAGYRVGLYTSPHLLDFTERIRVDGRLIPISRVVALTERIRRILRTSSPSLHPTFFEFTTAMAFAWFAEEAVDFAILEVGMGGRLDATNIVHPYVSILTCVDYDHQEHLGPTLREIAGEKCGIIKPGVPLITAETGEESLALMENACLGQGSPLYRLGKEFTCNLHRMDLGGMTLGFRFREKTFPGAIESRLTGRHQLTNVGISLAAVNLLRERGIRVDDEAIRKGVANARWPGRLEVIHRRPTVLLDGAHNAGGAHSLRDFLLEATPPGTFRKTFLVFGVLKDKDAEGMLSPLLPFFKTVVLTRPGTERARDPESLRPFVSPFPEVRVEIALSVAEAVSRVLESAKPDDLIVVTGSLYTVGEALAALSPSPERLSLRGAEGDEAISPTVPSGISRDGDPVGSVGSTRKT
ncbi:MAG: bifunctional folylpolyglutamate synthase/dihydrofolate synthase [Nitrospirae bacterium]|nr:bifunctional folylpolyglutamate synthase/dihydrofolate synthase [Nitrospirota bacterium]